MATEIGNECDNILDCRWFRTDGYIPVWNTQEDARRAFKLHFGEDVNGCRAFKVHIEINSKLYHRADKYDKWKHKLFFPIPLSAEDKTQQLMERYIQLYFEKTPNRKRYDWGADFAKLHVLELQDT